MAYPDATIYSIKDDGIENVAYTETEHYKTTKMFLDNPNYIMNKLFEERE